jgi:probable F420-dependent oxidoreductase
MTVRTTFGIRLPNSGPFAAPATIQDVATESEALGFDVLWVHDHLAWSSERRTHFAAGSMEAVSEGPANFYESITTVAFVAGMTRRINVGIAGLVVPFRDPRVLAKQLVTLDALSGGRLIPALAIGRYEDEFIAQQVPYRQRGRITDEYLACLSAILSPAQATSFEGTYVQIRDAEYFPKPQGLPIWIAGMSPQALRRVVKHGAGWLPGGTVEEIDEGWRTLAALLADAGRPAEQLERGLEIFTCIAPSDAQARTIAAASLQHQAGDVERGMRQSLVGSPATVASRMREYIAAGITHFELKFIAHTPNMMLEMIRQYAGDVLPGFKSDS